MVSFFKGQHQHLIGMNVIIGGCGDITACYREINEPPIYPNDFSAPITSGPHQE